MKLASVNVSTSEHCHKSLTHVFGHDSTTGLIQNEKSSDNSEIVKWSQFSNVHCTHEIWYQLNFEVLR